MTEDENKPAADPANQLRTVEADATQSRDPTVNTKPKAMSSLSRQWAFFVGLVLGTGASVPIVIYGLNFFADRVSAIVLGLIVVLTIFAAVFSILFINKEWILSRVFHGATGSFENVADSVGRLFDAKSNKALEAKRMGSELGAIYVWARIRFRMFTWLIALVFAIGSFIQGMLLFRQNELFEKQNKIVQGQEEFLRLQNETQSLSIGAELTSRAIEFVSDLELELSKAENEQKRVSNELQKDLSLFKNALIDHVTWDSFLEDAPPQTPDSFFKDSIGQISPSLRELLLLHFGRCEIVFPVSEIGVSGVATPASAPPTIRLSNSTYRKVAIQFDLWSNHNSKHRLYRASKADLLLAIMQLKELNLSPLAFGQTNVNDCFFSNRRIENLVFKDLDLRGSRFENVEFNRVDFDRCDLRSCAFVNCRFNFASFSDSLLPRQSKSLQKLNPLESLELVGFHGCETTLPDMFVGAFVTDQSFLQMGENCIKFPEMRLFETGNSPESTRLTTRSNTPNLGATRRGERVKVMQDEFFDMASGHDLQIVYEIPGLNVAQSQMFTGGQMMVSQDGLRLTIDMSNTLPFHLPKKAIDLPESTMIQVINRTPTGGSIGEIKSEIRLYKSVTGSQLFPSNEFEDWGLREDVKHVLENAGNNVTHIDVFNVVPSIAFTLNDYKILKAKNKDCKYSFHFPNSTLFDRRKLREKSDVQQ